MELRKQIAEIICEVACHSKKPCKVLFTQFCAQEKTADAILSLLESSKQDKQTMIQERAKEIYKLLGRGLPFDKLPAESKEYYIERGTEDVNYFWPYIEPSSKEEIIEKTAEQTANHYIEVIKPIWERKERERIFKKIEDTAIWHNRVLHYNPDAWQALKNDENYEPSECNEALNDYESENKGGLWRKK